MTNLPLVSIVIPVYNQERFIEDCLISVLNQTYKNLEIVVVDDNSSDNTREKVQKFENVTLLTLKKNSGPSFARNLGVSKSHGQLVAFCDGDDIWKSEKIEAQLKFHLAYGIDLSATKYETFGQRTDSRSHARVPNLVSKSWMLKNPLLTPFPPSVMMIRRETLQELGGWKEQLRFGEDLDLIRRAVFSDLQVGVLEEELSFQRIHEENVSDVSVVKRIPSYMQIIKSWIEESDEIRVSEVLVMLYRVDKSIIKTLMKEKEFFSTIQFFLKFAYFTLEVINDLIHKKERLK